VEINRVINDDRRLPATGQRQEKAEAEQRVIRKGGTPPRGINRAHSSGILSAFTIKYLGLCRVDGHIVIENIF
jgi:hypothetical protein